MAKRNKRIVKNQFFNKIYLSKSGQAVYGLGFIGALVYYISTAHSIGSGLLGIFKAILWPAFLTYGLLKFIGA